MSIARTVSGARRGTSHELIQNELNWPSLADRREGVIMKNLLKIVNKETPSYLRSLLPKKIGDVRPQSRNADNFYVVKASTETFRSSFIPSSVRLLNSLGGRDRNLTFTNLRMKKPQPSLLYHGSRINSMKHAQLRMNCSKLNFHLYSLHVLESPVCICGHNCEDSNHSLLHCPLYYVARNKMFKEIRNLSHYQVSSDMLLYGVAELGVDINREIFDAVHEFIEVTGRL